MKNVVCMLILSVSLIACHNGGRFESENHTPVPTPAPAPSLGLKCGVYDLSVLVPSVLPVFTVAPSTTVVTGTVYAGSPVTVYNMVGALNYSDTVAMLNGSGSTLSTWYGLDCKGKLFVSNGAVYTFKLTSDDGSKLWVDGYLLINNDGMHGATLKSGSIALSPGEHSVILDYMEGTGPVVLKLETNLPVNFYNY